MKLRPEMVLREFGRLFPPHIKDRGRQILNNGLLDPVQFEENGYASVAHGEKDYEVAIFQGELFCECPYYEDTGACKHLYALLLAIDELGRKSSNQTLPFPTPAPALRANWQPIVDSAIGEEDPGHPFGEDSRFGEHLIYRLSQPPSAIHHAMEIEIFYRERKKNGELTVPKPARIRRIDIERLPDSADRDILAEFLLVLPDHAAWSTYYLNDLLKSNLYLTGPRLPELARKLAQTNRLFAGPAFAKEHWRPVHWSPNKWRIRLRPEIKSEQWIEAALDLVDGDRVMPIKKAAFLDFRVVLYENTLAELETRSSHAWIRQAVQGQPLLIPRSDWPHFFGLVTSLRRGPSWELPDALKPKEVRGRPTPRLRLKFDSHRAIAEGTLTFLYKDGERETEAPDSDIHFTMSEDAAEVVLFDQPFHDACRNQLRQCGLQPGQDPISNRRHWTLALPRFATTVRTLLEEKWEVLAEGKPVRTSSLTKVKVSTNINWFDVEAVASYDGLEARLPELLDAMRNKTRYVRLGDGSIGLLPEEWINRYAPLANLGKEVDGVFRLKMPQAPLLDALLEEKRDVQTDEGFQQVRGRLRGFAGLKPAPQPEGFVGTMRPYQLEGLAWLLFLESIGLGGCLADDMGVGKTIQMLALLELHRARRAAGESLPPDLVIVPKSLLFNWEAEAARFTPKLRLLNYTGTARSRREIASHDVILTTYGTLRRDVVDLKNIEFATIVLDEAQAIKNSGSDSAKATRILDGRSRAVMTGTPVENHLGELWSLFEFLNPGLLGASTFFKAGTTMEPESRDWLRKALRPLVLRRTKQQVASDLPARSEQVIHCELDTEQRKLYNTILLKVKKDLERRIQQDGLAKSKLHVLEALLRLRQIACHPQLVQETAKPVSAKFDVLIDQLTEIADEGHKALVFSQFTSLLALLKPRLDEVNLPYEYLDGSTTDRQQRVEHFQSDAACPIFLLSLKAGGTGLNLTAADYVYLLDPWWNPAVEAQAIDRTHRIGQTRPVFAYRIVAKDTIEERILELQQSKRDLAEAILSEDNATLATLRKEDLDYLLS
ncbi:MAG: SNF2 helicase associated domain-containing protein [Acidobacteria bacterium]|nr:SNF2 helicase associated domain-containing protein [Acidobacteriota bacterium]